MEGRNVVVTFKAPAGHRAVLSEVLGGDAVLVYLADVPPGGREAALRGADVLLTWSFGREIAPFRGDVLERASFLQLMSAGADHIPYEDLAPRIVVASNAGAYAGPMAEHVMAMVLALAKRLLVKNEKLRRGEWDQLEPNLLLRGLASGILGYGGIGRACARLMRAFGMRILALNTRGESPDPADFIGTLRDIDRVLGESDVVVVALPLTKRTRGLIGARELRLMKPEAILVNVSRAAILDEAALYEHVKNHPGFLVGIDAWWTEPFMHGEFRMEYPFLDLPNVLGSPHNSAVTARSLVEAARLAAENVRRFLRGEAITGVIRREDYV